MNLHNAKTISNKYDDTFGILCYLMNSFDLSLSIKEVEDLAQYLSFYNYTTYKESYYYGHDGAKNKFVQAILNTNGETAYIIYDYRSNELTLVEPNSTTNFTEGERIDFIFTRTGKIVLQTFDEFNKTYFYDEEKSQNIEIDEYREVLIPSNLEPDDLLDFSDNSSDFYKLVSIRNKVELIKLNKVLEQGSEKNAKL